jgi:hypothetical protein
MQTNGCVCTDLYAMSNAALHRVKRGSGMRLATCPRLVSRLNMIRDKPLLTLVPTWFLIKVKVTSVYFKEVK